MTHRRGGSEADRLIRAATRMRRVDDRSAPSSSPSHEIGEDRARAIARHAAHWMNGTDLRFHFFNRDTDRNRVLNDTGAWVNELWAGSMEDENLVREAFDAWAATGLGLRFRETPDREEAEIRIGFQPNGGHWSRTGRHALEIKAGHRTMNLDTTPHAPFDLNTALRQIGTALGLERGRTAHRAKGRGAAQSKVSAASPIGWTQRSADERSPHDAHRLDGLSPRDVAWALKVYPPRAPLDQTPRLLRFESHPIDLEEGEQFDAVYAPTESGPHAIGVYGEADMLLTLFRNGPDGPRFLAGDDDSGAARNALITARLDRGAQYIIRTRMFFNRSAGRAAVMIT